MPEGDTIWRLATALRHLLVDDSVVDLRLRGQRTVRELAGTTVDRVESLGKHLLIALGPSWVLHVHLGLDGRWQHLPDGSARDGDGAALHTQKSGLHLVRRPQIAELVRRDGLRHHPRLARLGPDLLAPDVAYEQLLQRARHPRYRRLTLAELLLDQHVACGIGNVYRSEVLFLASSSPSRIVSDVSDSQLVALYELASRRMRDNLGRDVLRTLLGPAKRQLVTRRLHERDPEHPRYWVYRRAGRSCLRCAAARIMRQADRGQRFVFYCPACQS